jgi:hypothetical protein
MMDQPLSSSHRQTTPFIRSAALLGLWLLLAPLAAAAQNPECPAYSKPARAKVAISGSNVQYFRYNNKTIPLVGASSEYLCHVLQPGSYGSGSNARTPANDFCEFTNYTNYMDYLGIVSFSGPGFIQAEPLNKLQLWISLNSSPGFDRGEGRPYPNEAPFPDNCPAWQGACPSPTWNLGAKDTTFYNRLKCVLDYAWSKDIVVEVTIFDAWQGNHLTGPWKNAFSHRACFSSKDWVDPATGKRCDDPSLNNETNGWSKQRLLISNLATELCSYPNIYYEIANEADFIPGIPNMTPAMVRSWHQDMRNALVTADAGCGHLIASNFNDDGNLTATASTYSVLNTHYTSTGSASTYGANELLRARHNGGAAELNKAFGFNETKYTTLFLPPPPNNSFQGSDTARAEAWEFLTSEGAIYDLYGELWQVMSDTAVAIDQLKTLRGLLDDLPLDRMSRSLSAGGAQPSWLSGLTSYGGSFRWGAMHSPMNQAGDANVLYIHHSNLQLSGFQRYVPVTGSYTENLSVKLPAGTYRVEWIEPQTGIIQVSVLKTITAAQAGTPQSIAASHTYDYDVALRITRQ